MEGFSTDTWAGIFFVIAIISIAGAVLSVAIWQVATYARTRVSARVEMAKEQEYRRLAQQATRAQEEAAKQLARLDAIEEQLASIERMLREIDEPVTAR